MPLLFSLFHSNAIMSDSGSESGAEEVSAPPQYERVVSRSGVRQYLIVEHSANLRNGSAISSIWAHGVERTRDEDSILRPIKWWLSKRAHFPTLSLFALDLLCCPAMSTECERVFSGAKKTITVRVCGLVRPPGLNSSVKSQQ
jgi:hypothetical protein